MNQTDSEKAIKKALKDIEDKFGTTLRKLGDSDYAKVEILSTGSYSLNRALGIGGYPRGRLIEIFGTPSGGKTFLSLLAIAETQKAGGTAAFLDVEHALDPEWAKMLGVDIGNLYFQQPDYGEQALEMLEKLVQSNAFDIIVLDSTASLIPKAELEGDLEKQAIGQHARMMSKGLRRLTASIGKSKTVVIFINQVRTNPMVLYGNPETTPGGQALKFYCSVRVRVTKAGGSDIKDGQRVIGHKIMAKIVKNKVGSPYAVAEIIIKYTEGIDRIDELITEALATGIIQHNGKTYTIDEDYKWIGQERVREGIKDDEKLQKLIGERLSALTKKKNELVSSKV